MRVSTPWIYSPKFDLAAIIGPAVAVTGIVLIWGRQIAAVQDTPPWLWILLVLGIDVAHVYSSLFRTYFDREEFQKRKTLYIVAPLVCWVVGVAVYALWGGVVFWTCVAYFAIYHFVRQQYGFLMLYRRGEPTGSQNGGETPPPLSVNNPKAERRAGGETPPPRWLGALGYRLDQLAIYMATIYPLVYWHTYGRAFEWFDGIYTLRIPSVWPEYVCRVVYVLAIGGFLAKEAWRWRETGAWNAGKSLLLITTAVSWFTGIILFNGDLTFTIINIVSHGVPYMALIWIYQYRKRRSPSYAGNRFLRFFQLKYVPFYVGALFLLAYFEEGLWDKVQWKEHGNIFGNFSFSVPAGVLTVLIPLLTMPQVTHYVLDAFIWRVNKKGKEEVRAVLAAPASASAESERVPVNA